MAAWTLEAVQRCTGELSAFPAAVLRQRPGLSWQWAQATAQSSALCSATSPVPYLYAQGQTPQPQLPFPERRPASTLSLRNIFKQNAT